MNAPAFACIHAPPRGSPQKLHRPFVNTRVDFFFLFFSFSFSFFFLFPNVRNAFVPFSRVEKSSPLFNNFFDKCNGYEKFIFRKQIVWLFHFQTRFTSYFRVEILDFRFYSQLLRIIIIILIRASNEKILEKLEIVLTIIRRACRVEMLRACNCIGETFSFFFFFYHFLAINQDSRKYFSTLIHVVHGLTARNKIGRKLGNFKIVKKERRFKRSLIIEAPGTIRLFFDIFRKKKKKKNRYILSDS